VKELRRNMRIIGTLVILAFVVLCAGYALTVYTQGSTWASTAYNTRASASNALRGDITDRDGVVLATTDESGERVYLADAQARRALSQTVGDVRGMSGTGVETYHSSTLMDISTSLVGRLSELVSGERHVGSSIQLTIDAELQAYVSSIFPEGYKGAVCIVNYRTGEILAMVSKPDYDPEDILDRQASADVEDTAYLNRCLQGLYTPGSVFKIVTLASALSNDPSVVYQTFKCAGVWEFGNSKVNCAGNTAHGTVDLETAFAKSCNVTFGKLAYQLGGDRLRATAEEFGFNVNFKLGDVILYNAQFPTSMATDADLVWAGVGQGTVLVTPLHMAMIAACVANGGVMMKPYLIRQVVSSSGAADAGEAEAYRRVMAPEVAGTIAAYMREAVTSGTATKAAISGYTVCGKTGSAETSDDKTIETNAWYVGFVYDDQHPYAISVVIEEAGAGGTQAAPIAAKALKKALE
jgi:peptidoglycan glycosyltransferase